MAPRKPPTAKTGTAAKAPRRAAVKPRSAAGRSPDAPATGPDSAQTPVRSRSGRSRTPRDRGATFRRVAKPDAFDARDLPFRPNVSVTPREQYIPTLTLIVKHQGDSNACTGFALSSVVEFLLRTSGREPRPAISPFMLYSMARRYDEFPGSACDNGSSLRGALKGWFKHGACAQELFPTIEMPPASAELQRDWWLDAVKRPLGAYYRIDTRNITEMHAAINEVGILYASAGCHPGWEAGTGVDPSAAEATPVPRPYWTIPLMGEDEVHDGHAFVIVGYTSDGFLIQNSWGPDWGTRGLAILTYDDWLRNAMDCWVVQLGVITREHIEIAGSISLRTRGERVRLAGGRVLRNRELSPFIVNVGNNGQLSNSGVFRTTPDDLRAIVDVQLPAARRAWGLDDKPVDVCVYAHGGLVGEKDAAETAAEWIPMLYESQILPVFVMWETDFISTVRNIVRDAADRVPRATGGIGGRLERWWNERLERWLARPGTVIWGEMKQNAEAMSLPMPSSLRDTGAQQAAMILLYQHFKARVRKGEVRLHIVGHSAGAIVASHFVDQLAGDDCEVESLNLMAPAVRIDAFRRLVVPHLESGKVRRYQQMHLTDKAEEDDPTCGPYRRSLLYLVSRSFEGGTTTPLLGMDRYFREAGIPCDRLLLSPSGADPASAVSADAIAPVASSTHGGFDNDRGAQQAILRFIKRARD